MRFIPIIFMFLSLSVCDWVTKFPNDPYKEGEYWMIYLKTSRRNCWKPKGHIYMKTVYLSLDNQLLIDELAFYFTSCILESRQRPLLLCRKDDYLTEAPIRNCAKSNAFAWSLFKSFADKIPLMAFYENLKISRSDLEDMTRMVEYDDNLAAVQMQDYFFKSTENHKPVFPTMRVEMQRYIIEQQRNQLSEIQTFVEEILNSIISFITESIFET